MGDLLSVFAVAPLVGARIEITVQTSSLKISNVAPLVGARIEMLRACIWISDLASLPSWERGLK